MAAGLFPDAIVWTPRAESKPSTSSAVRGTLDRSEADSTPEPRRAQRPWNSAESIVMPTKAGRSKAGPIQQQQLSQLGGEGPGPVQGKFQACMQ